MTTKSILTSLPTINLLCAGCTSETTEDKKTTIFKRKFRVLSSTIKIIFDYTILRISTLILFSALLVSCTTVNNDSLGDHTSGINQTVELQNFDGFWLIPVTINDVDLSLILDTGAGTTALFQNERTSSFFQTATGTKRIGGFDGSDKAIKTKKFKNARVQVGKLPEQVESLALLNDNQSPIHPWNREKIDGAIGFPLLSKFDIKIDRVENKVYFSAPGSLLGNASPSDLKIQIVNKVPTFIADVSFLDSTEIKNATAWIDTGAQSAVKINTTYIADDWIDSDAKKSYVRTAFGLGTYSKSKPALISETNGEYSLKAVTLLRSSSSKKTKIILGRSALMGDIITISYHSGLMRISSVIR